MPDKEHDKLYLGIDIGSVSISYAVLTEEYGIVKAGYHFHYGNVRKALEKILSRIDAKSIYQVGFNQKAADFINYGFSVNEQIAIIEGVRLLVPDVGSIFTIGGENFGLILFDQHGHYKKCITNSSCAAGTGAFLDQQANRLGLKDSAQLSKIAQSFQGEPPKIATRCAVFAKTDLNHCQQQGYSLSSICAGLCKGLAHNIADTLVKGVKLRQPIVAVGGVSKNNKVMDYLSQIIGKEILVPRYAHIAGALGCAIIARKNSKGKARQKLVATGSNDHLSCIADFREIIIQKPSQKSYFFEPLEKQQSIIPDFSCYQRYVCDTVEVDLYERPIRGVTYSCYLGIDIGSTSTKALLLEESGKVLLGVYTRTQGQPIEAVTALLKTLHNIEKSYHVQFHFLSVGTTGAGRKFIQKVIGADLAIDEITAHARAAYFLNPETDTIIEIGGQDSKFTVMKDGQVTFSVMNYVCAAGTGSFIEEQAKRLKTPLDRYAQLATGVPAPLTSDRCTVFMERDLNHLLTQGYTKQELLAATLHSVRDNYLSKVAHLNKIGQAICFQGATAKNQALVLTFEQKLRKPIFVSKYCHLTGALGICLIMKEKNLRVTQFRGLEFYKSQPQVYDEICELCKNHCKLKKIKIGQETIGWGYLCGRDETDTSFKNKNRSGFDLLSSRRKILRPKTPGVKYTRSSSGSRGKSLLVQALSSKNKIFSTENEKVQNITIGIPYALYTVEYCQFWQLFFEKLGHKVIISPSKETHLSLGKEIAGAEFCAPIVNLHGHVKYLADQVDFIFIPSMFEDDQSKYFCYYSNYATAILANTDNLRLKEKSICPVIDFRDGQTINIQEIYDSFPETLRTIHSLESLEFAFQEAWNWNTVKNRELIQTYETETASITDIAVVLLGRPYTVLDPIMNKRIPQKFNEFGIKTFFQDMLPVAGKRLPLAKQYLEWNHWHYGAQILRAAETVAQSEGVYPVYLTAFKCSPDSFILEYFKEIMDHYQKPYLILQLDEHSSDVGYETRVEAAIRSFKNHYQSKRESARIKSPKISMSSKVTQKTVLIPNYDPIACELVCAVFENMGYQAFLIEETDTTVHSSLRLNDGQCLPISCITQAVIHTIDKHNLDPTKVTFFINALTQLSCNLPQYPLLIKRLLEKEGNGLEKVQVWATEFEMLNFPLETVYDVYFAYLLGGLLRKVACKIRPYELNQGQTDEVLQWATDRLYTCFSKGRSKDLFFREVIQEFNRIPVNKTARKRPQVAIIGDLYVRDNAIFNQNLVQQLEGYGAEVITTPFNYLIRLTAVKHLYQLRKYRQYLPLIRDKILIETLELFERRFYKVAEPILQELFPKFDESLLQYLERYHITPNHGGETAQNVLKIFSLLEHYSGIRLFVHVNPIFCCPALVSEAIFKKIEEDIRIPIVSITYDGTQSNKNIALVPYLHYK